MDKMREDFEAWFLKEMEIDISQYRNHDPRTSVEWPYDGGNEMASQVFTIAYKAWQASRKAVVVNIDSHTEFEIEHIASPKEDGYAKGWIDGRNYSVRQVEYAGITVKQ